MVPCGKRFEFDCEGALGDFGFEGLGRSLGRLASFQS